MKQDHGLKNLLDLDGVVLVIHEAGYWVKFEVKQVAVTRERPHGIDYSFTLHAPDNERIAGFDNAHAVKRAKGPGGKTAAAYDHKHRFEKVKAYMYVDALTLIDDFWAAVDEVLKAEGAVG